MTRVRPFVFAASAALALTLSQAQAVTFVVPKGACDVLTDASAKKLLGPAAKLTRKAQPNPYMSQCQYTSPNGQITVMTGDWRMLYTKTPLDKAVPGLGNEAWLSPSGLAIRKGAVGMSVLVIAQSGEYWGAAADAQTNLEAVAEKKVATEILPHL